MLKTLILPKNSSFPIDFNTNTVQMQSCAHFQYQPNFNTFTPKIALLLVDI